jgi:hypothetical protein
MIETKFSQTHAEQPNFSDSNAACDARYQGGDNLTKKSYKSKR